MPQWRSQIVRDRITESLQLFVRPFQLGGALVYADFEFVVKYSDLSFVFFSLSDVAKSRNATAHLAMEVSYRRGAHLDPGTFGDLGIANKHLGCAHLASKSANQWNLIARKRRHCVREEKPVVFRPFWAVELRCAQAKYFLSRWVPENKFPQLVGGHQAFNHAVKHGLKLERLDFQGSPRAG